LLEHLNESENVELDLNFKIKTLLSIARITKMHSLAYTENTEKIGKSLIFILAYFCKSLKILDEKK